ncbi:MAG: exosortase H [Acidobacteria bacterium]|nr:MAG: exosortase H [Acidobacteriota bacterium]
MAAPDNPPAGWRAYRREIAFLTTFALVLGLGFSLLALQPVNDRFVVPLTAGIARLSGALLALLGQDVRMAGTQIISDRFAVNIENGCNGVEAMIIFLAAVLAFPASWRARAAGLLLGMVAIQLVNLLRVVALFLTGVYFRDFFDSSHTVVWQTVVILFALLLWLYWAGRWAAPRPARIAE